jgi:hypothetical protein
VFRNGKQVSLMDNSQGPHSHWLLKKTLNKHHWWRIVRGPIHIDYWRKHWTSPGADNHMISTMQTWGCFIRFSSVLTPQKCLK